METHTPWWKSAVIYQIYPRSFADANGDGLGDLRGIIKKLDYLDALGVDALWLSPVFRSPQDDNGYDVSDYRDIDPIFGTLEDMDELIREAKKRNIRILLDLVLNHSSDEHPWFLAARKDKNDPHHDYYIWRDGVEGIPPNDLPSGFGGSAWEWVPEIGQYYFHHFSRKQPELNWENPALRRELYDIVNFWIDRGVGGFRLDVIDHISKADDLRVQTNGPRLHEFIRELTRETFARADLVTVGEAWSADTDTAQLYSAPDGSELSMVFQFEHILLDWNGSKWTRKPLHLPALKQCLSRWQNDLHGKGWNSLFWNNHDLPRIVSRRGDDGKYRVESAKMLAILLHGMQGTPYIYQGEELGMTNMPLPLDGYRDIETLDYIRVNRARGVPEADIAAAVGPVSRDNARTPMQWTAEKNAGFTSGTPWLPVNPNHSVINAASQVTDENSVFSCYRDLIRLRKSHPVFADGTYTLLCPEHERVFAYRREDEAEELLVVANFFGVTEKNPIPLRLGDWELLAAGYPDPGEPDILRPFEARLYGRRK